jgi:hypothetical protein
LAIIQVQEERANEFLPELIKQGKTVGTRWKQAKEHAAKKCSSKEDQQILKTFADHRSAWTFGFVKRQCEIVPAKLPVSLNKLSNLKVPPNEKEWDTLCNLIGMTQEIRKKMGTPVEVRKRPLFVLPGKKVLLADLSNALDVLWENFEEIAKDDQNFYDNRYQRRKAGWLEEKVRSSLSRIFPSSQIYQNLSYPDPDKNDSSTAEIDFAVHWGPLLVLIEAKAKQFRLELQLGDVGRLRTDIKKNVEDAFEQARRTARYIGSVEKPELREIKGNRVLTFRRGDIRRTYLLTVSQHHLAGIANRLEAASKLGLFRHGEYPLSICAADLETVAEFCPGPDTFLHYIERRLHLQKMPTQFLAEELDFFGAYLDTRLQQERLWEEKKRPDWMALTGWSVKFDKWMEFKRGECKDAPELRLQVPSEIEEILVELRRRKNDDGARWIAFALLDLSDRVLFAIAKMVQEVRNATLTPGMFRRVSHQEGETVVSLVASLDLPRHQLREATRFRTIVEKYRRRATKSVGIGIIVTDHSKPFDCAVWEEGPWQYDPMTEKLIAGEPEFLPAPGQKLPGRNEPCVCGSGKKFKKCCLLRIEASLQKKMNQ